MAARVRTKHRHDELVRGDILAVRAAPVAGALRADKILVADAFTASDFIRGTQCANTSSSAALSVGGRGLLRRAALRRMPSQAFLLKQYFAGALACKICDKVDAISSLGHAPVFRPLNAPRDGETISQDLARLEPLVLRRSRYKNGIVADVDEGLERSPEILSLRR